MMSVALVSQDQQLGQLRVLYTCGFSKYLLDVLGLGLSIILVYSVCVFVCVRGHVH